MTTLLVLGDIHGDVAALHRIRLQIEKLPPEWTPDLALATGDFGLAGFGGAGLRRFNEETVATVLSQLERLPCPVLFVPGNHDPPRLAGDGVRLRSIDVLANQQAVEFQGVRFTGFGGSWSLGGAFPYEWEDGETLAVRLAQLLAADGDQPEVLLTHVPPIGCGVGRLLSGEEVGSQVVRGLIEQRAPLLNVCGHVHEANGLGFLGATWVLNPGAISGIRRWWGNGLVDTRAEKEPQYGNCLGSFHLLRFGQEESHLSGLLGECFAGAGWLLRRVEGNAGQVTLSS
jgi:uncharacterized protein